MPNDSRGPWDHFPLFKTFLTPLVKKWELKPFWGLTCEKPLQIFFLRKAILWLPKGFSKPLQFVFLRKAILYRTKSFSKPLQIYSLRKAILYRTKPFSKPLQIPKIPKSQRIPKIQKIQKKPDLDIFPGVEFKLDPSHLKKDSREKWNFS